MSPWWDVSAVELPEGFELIETCGACPEQYDLRYRGKNVGYFRLRHGMFRVEYPYIYDDTTMDYGDTDIVYSFNVGDHEGIFDNQEQRIEQLTIGARAVIERMTK